MGGHRGIRSGRERAKTCKARERQGIARERGKTPGTGPSVRSAGYCGSFQAGTSPTTRWKRDTAQECTGEEFCSDCLQATPARGETCMFTLYPADDDSSSSSEAEQLWRQSINRLKVDRARKASSARKNRRKFQNARMHSEHSEVDSSCYESSESSSDDDQRDSSCERQRMSSRSRRGRALGRARPRTGSGVTPISYEESSSCHSDKPRGEISLFAMVHDTRSYESKLRADSEETDS